MANEKRLIDANALKTQFDDIPPFIGMTGGCVQQYIDKAPTVDAVPLDQYNELKERYKRLLETADILDSALRAYQRKYGDLDAEDAKMEGGNEDG